MKYPLPRKKKKALKKGDCGKSILFEVILEERGPKAAIRLLKQWDATSPKEVFDREIHALIRQDGLSPNERKRVYQYATPTIIDRTSFPNMPDLAREALKYARVK